MSVLEASNNEGRYNMVHRQTDDGSILSVVVDGDLMPLVFSYTNYFNCPEESILSSGYYPHKNLMRGDCGVEVEYDSVDISYNWDSVERHVDGFSAGPSNEYTEIYHDVFNNASNAVLEGHRGYSVKAYRKDREYWTPDTTLSAVSEEPLFGFSQWNPISKPFEPNACGIANFYDECDKKEKLRNNICKEMKGE